MNLACLDEVDGGWSTASVGLAVHGELAQPLSDRHAGCFEHIGCAGSGHDREPEFDKALRGFDAHGLVSVGEREEHRARFGQRSPSGHLALGEGTAGVRVDTHDLSGRTHLGAEQRVGVGEAAERQHGFLDRHMTGDRVGEQPFVTKLGQRGTEHHPGGNLCKRHASGLGHERHRARCTRVRLDHIGLVILHCELHVDEANDFEFVSNLGGVLLERCNDLGGKVWRRNHAGAIARVHTGFFDVFHNGTDQEVAVAIANGVDIDLGGVFEKAVDKHGTFSRKATLATQRTKLGKFVHCSTEASVVVDNLHAAAAKYVRRAHERRVANARDDVERLFGGRCRAAWRLRNRHPLAERIPLLAIFGKVDRCR